VAGRDGCPPEIFRFMLDLAVGGEVLRKFLLRDGRNRGIGAK
jgi:hypothetical protein